jgi:hypothetical protein
LDGLKFQVTTGSRSLGGFIGEDMAFHSWAEEKTRKWAGAVDELVLAAKNSPQAAYSGLQQSLQQEWQFLQRVQKDCGEKIVEVKKSISRTFLPALFDDEYDDDDPRRQLACLPVKHDGWHCPKPHHPHFQTTIPVL